MNETERRTAPGMAWMQVIHRVSDAFRANDHERGHRLVKLAADIAAEFPEDVRIEQAWWGVKDTVPVTTTTRPSGDDQLHSRPATNSSPPAQGSSLGA